MLAFPAQLACTVVWQLALALALVAATATASADAAAAHWPESTAVVA